MLPAEGKLQEADIRSVDQKIRKDGSKDRESETAPGVGDCEIR